MSPLAAKAGCAERTTKSQQKLNGLPSGLMTTKDRFLQSTQSLLEALPQGPINIQQHTNRCLMPVLPSFTATDSGLSGNATKNGSNGNSSSGNNGLAPAIRLPRGGAPKGRMACLRVILRRLRATAQANGTKFRICLTAQGLARAKVALLKARSVQPVPVKGVAQAMALPKRPTAQQPASGATATATPSRRNRLAKRKPEPPTAAASRQSRKTSTRVKGKAKPTVTAARTASSTPATKADQGLQKRPRHAGQSLRTAAKGVYTEDSIRVYLQEIGRIRLLRPDEEIELARKIADLLYLEQEAETYFRENEHYPSISEWAEKVAMPYRSFKRRLKLGRRAKEKMVQSNLRLVVSIAKKYMNRGLSFQDLIQEGSLGLVRAAEKFDHEKGYKFSTYATWWIRQAITRAIADQSRTIRLPVHLYETISRIKKSTKTLSQELGRKPSEEEIAERMEMTIEKLRFIAKSAQLPISLETPVGKEEDSRLGDFIESDTENPDQDVAKNLLREDLESVLATLNPRERDVLRLRYGLDDGRMKTLEDIGQIFEVTRERIRQIEAKALRKLRHPNRNGVLKEYIK